MPSRGEYAMKFHKNFHVVAVAAALMMLGTQAAVVSSSDVLGAVSRWSSANGAAFSGPGVPVSATPAYDDDGTTVLYWIVTMSNGGAVIASPDTDLDLVVAVLEVYDGPLPKGHPLPDILKTDMRNRLAVLAERNGTSSSSGLRKQKAVASPASSQGTEDAAADGNDALAKSIAAANAQWAKYSGGTSSGTRLRKQKAAKLEGGDASPYVRRVVDGFESKGRFTFWNQSSLSGGKYVCFNAFTPHNAVCGCVATAGAAILHFFNCTNDPGTVKSDKASYNNVPGTYSTIAGVTDWSILPTNIVSGTTGFEAPDDAGHELLGRVAYNMGVLVDMGWTSEESGAYLSDLVKAFKAYGFKTSRYVGYSGGETSDGTEFMKTLYAQLWCGAPVPLSIRSPTGGHAVIACGYARDGDGDEFCRVFMGWGGSGDAWYKLPKIQDYNQVNGAVTMIGYEDDAVVPIYGEANVPGVDLTLPGYIKDGVPVTVTVNGNGFFGIRVPPSLTDTTVMYEPRGVSETAMPFDGNVLANESAGRNELDDATPNEMVFSILNMTKKPTMESGKAVASRDGKALLMVSCTPGSDRTKALMNYIYYLDDVTDISNKFVLVYNTRSSANPNEPDGDPSIGVFDPDTFVADERWKETNGRIEYENFIDYEASGETNVTVYTFTPDDAESMTNRVDEILKMGYVANLRRHSGIVVNVRGFNVSDQAYNESVAVEPDYGEVTDAWTNGEFAVFSAPGTYTNETDGVVYSCVGWVTNEVDSVADAALFTAGSTAKFQVFADTTTTLTWIWDVSHYRVTAGPLKPYTSSTEWNDAVTPTELWVAAGGRATFTAKDAIGGYGFKYWSVKPVKSSGLDYFDDPTTYGISENGTSVSFTVNEPARVIASYQSGAGGAPAPTARLLVLVSSPKEFESLVQPPVDGGFKWGENEVLDSVFKPVFTGEVFTDSTGGVWKCAETLPAEESFNLSRLAATEVTLVWKPLSEPAPEPGPEPQPPEPDPPQPPEPEPPKPTDIVVSGIDREADGSWTITVSGAVKDCWYWLYATEDLSKVTGDSAKWTASKATTTENNPQQATADGDIVFHAATNGEKFYWRAKATSTEADE